MVSVLVFCKKSTQPSALSIQPLIIFADLKWQWEQIRPPD